MTPGWIAVKKDRKVHVMPDFGPEHHLTLECWCSPFIEHYALGLIIHVAGEMDIVGDGEIEEITFDERAISDDSLVSALVGNAVNQLEIALFKCSAAEAIHITNAIGELTPLMDVKP